ncbi:Alpha-ketoglutarate dependent xanthine dioxygenase [Geosmithia morbida]|uniref:Alpha-ketoglutarate dependent xanthine dioxygenase n=1 Tax=Geosmithia morbida TaxID=1094350 RepID=A0A9P4Z0T6_9HYPO|nr:Alpha-ketoglutarate dependent xanthine dioxygenase [Geosmithia morbida]KAF4125336.1 Alpha-ketoglutarate dependent xanthine dioxygenase [Geosmithia morbida]
MSSTQIRAKSLSGVEHSGIDLENVNVNMKNQRGLTPGSNSGWLNDLKTIPSHPQVKVIGHRHVDKFESLMDLTLIHPHHKTFHKHTIPEDDDLTHMHFYRWNIDPAITVEYAPHPYIWLSKAKARSNGLGLLPDGLELPENVLSDIDENGTCIGNLKVMRETIYRLQRSAISPQFAYPHAWDEGDLVLFNNDGVMHSIV